jgi:hypothetical protein
MGRNFKLQTPNFKKASNFKPQGGALHLTRIFNPEGIGNACKMQAGAKRFP